MSQLLTFFVNHMSASCSKLAGAAADSRECGKTMKYTELAEKYWFVPVGVETLGSWGTEGHKLIKNIGKKVMEETGEKRKPHFFFRQFPLQFKEEIQAVY